jgi:hypothetical protein
MAGRGATTFEKRQKEQNRKEKRQDKLARRLQRKTEGPKEETSDSETPEGGVAVDGETPTAGGNPQSDTV